MKMTMTCRDVIVRLSDYLDGELGPLDVAGIQFHLARCARCRACVRTLSATIRVTGRAADIKMPEEMKLRLRVFLRDRH